ncbi:MAG: protein-glutamate O-methyltransferase CheR [Candidatus Obscuribacterales bacterium]
MSIDTLLNNIVDKYGFDFRNYATASLHRRIASVMRAESVHSVEDLQERVINDPAAFERFLHSLTVNVTAMFRDPHVFMLFKHRVIPQLSTYPFIRVWLTGCSTGEEAYSLSIMLEEAGLGDRVRIYATDIDPVSVQQAREGIFPISSMKEYSENYVKAGGRTSLSDYYTADGESAIFRQALRRNIVFAQHNLVCDGSFNEFNVILCRNVLIYFNIELRDRVLTLLHESLVPLGFLALGTKESLRYTANESCYELIGEAEKIYRKVL